MNMCHIIASLLFAAVALFPATAAQLKSQTNRYSYVAGQPVRLHLTATDTIEDVERVTLQVMWLDRIIIRKELPAQLPIKAEFKFPSLRPGVVADAVITVSVLGRRGDMMAQWQHKIHVYADGWLANREESLRNLKICVVGSKARQAAQALSDHGIPARAATSASASTGRWLVCRGLDLQSTPGTLGSIVDLAGKGTSILVLPPFRGEVTVDWRRFESVLFSGSSRITEMDHRLDTGLPVAGAFEIAVVDGAMGIRFVAGARRQWFSADVKGGGRVVICGFDFLGALGRHPAALRVLELLFLDKSNIFPHTEETE